MLYILFFFFNDTATTEIYTLSLHDALPISGRGRPGDRGSRESRRARCRGPRGPPRRPAREPTPRAPPPRSEEHTSELQSPDHLVCRLLLEKKKRRTLVHRLAVTITL